MSSRMLLICLILLAGCAPLLPDPAASYTGQHAGVCSPVDAPGMEFDIARLEGAGPHRLVFTIWGGWLDDGSRHRIEDPDREGGLALCDENGNCHLARPPFWLQLQPAEGPVRRGQLWWRAEAGWRGATFETSPATSPPLICG